MKRSFCIVAALGSLPAAWLGTSRLAAAQPAAERPVLERLERQIRNRPGQAQRPGNPAEDPGAARSDPAAAEAAAEQPAGRTAARASREPGYVGVLADDRKDRGRGVRILEVRPGGPAAKSGLQKGDLVTGVAGIRVRQMTDMAEVLALFPAGDSVVFDVLRGQKQQAIKVVLGRRPAPAAQPAEGPPVGPPPTEPPAQPAGPEPPPPAAPGPPANAAAELQRLQQRIEQLERRVAELERRLAEVLKSK